MRSGLCFFVICFTLFSGGCSLMVSFDDPAEPKCDMSPPDCSVASCLVEPECQWQPCSIENIFYDSPPSCADEEERLLRY